MGGYIQALAAGSRIGRRGGDEWWARQDSNLQPSGYPPLALGQIAAK